MTEVLKKLGEKYLTSQRNLATEKEKLTSHPAYIVGYVVHVLANLEDFPSDDSLDGGAYAEFSRYQIERLMVVCEHILCNSINVNNVAEILILAERHSRGDLNSACVRFISCPDNFKAVALSKEFSKLMNVCPHLKCSLAENWPNISELESTLAEYTKKFSSVQQAVKDLAWKYEYNPNEDYAETEMKLRGHLETFLETVKNFNSIYTKEIRPWTHMMEVPQLHGFGPAANRLLEAYNTLQKFLGDLRGLRESYATMAAGSQVTSNEPSSVAKIIMDCESALTFLNRSLTILSTSVAREQGEKL